MLRHLQIVPFSLGLTFATPADTIHQIKKAQSELSRLAPQGCTTCGATSSGSEDPPWRQCLKAVCPDGYGTLYDRLGHRAAHTKDVISPQFIETLRHAAITHLRGELSDLEEVRGGLAKNQQITDPLGLRVMTLFNAVSLSKLTKNGSKKLKDLSPTDKAKVKFAEKVLSDVGKADPGPLKEDYEFFVQRHPPAEIASAARRAVAQLQEVRLQIQKTTGGISSKLFDSIKPETLRKVERAEIDVDAFNDLKDAMQNLQSAKTMLRADVSGLGPLDTSLGSVTMVGDIVLAQRARLMRHYIDTDDLEDIATATDEVGVALRDALNVCGSSLLTAREFAPTEAENDQFKKKLPDLKARFMRSVAPRLSVKSSTVLAREVESKWSASTPSTFEMQRAALMAAIKDDTEDSIAKTREKEAARKLNPQFMAVFAATNGPIGPTYKAADDLSTLCVEHTIQPIRDAAYQGSGDFLVGPVSVTLPAFGDPVVRHEFGHLLSHLFSTDRLSSSSKKWYEDVRSCLKKPGVASSVEEDWADYVSSLGGQHGFICYFMWDNQSELNISSVTEGHSSNLYRLLQDRSLNGRSVPNECVQALRLQGDEFKAPCPKSTLAREASAR